MGQAQTALLVRLRILVRSSIATARPWIRSFSPRDVTYVSPRFANQELEGARVRPPLCLEVPAFFPLGHRLLIALRHGAPTLR